MKILRIAAATVVLVLALCATSWAQAPTRLEITPVIGGQLFLIDLPATFALEREDGRPAEFRNMEFSPAVTLGGNLGVRLRGRWGLEGNFRYTPAVMSPRGGSGTEYDVNMYSVGGSGSVIMPSRYRGVQPYVVAGAGVKLMDFAADDLKTQRELMWNFGGGIALELTPGVGVLVEARDYVSQFRSGLFGVRDKLQNDLVLVAGLRLTLGSDGSSFAIR